MHLFECNQSDGKIWMMHVGHKNFNKQTFQSDDHQYLQKGKLPLDLWQCQIKSWRIMLMRSYVIWHGHLSVVSHFRYFSRENFRPVK